MTWPLPDSPRPATPSRRSQPISATPTPRPSTGLSSRGRAWRRFTIAGTGQQDPILQLGKTGARLSFPAEMRYALHLGNRFRWNASTVMNKTNKRGPHEDRRIEDVGPPDGWRDRRRHVERRIPTAAGGRGERRRLGSVFRQAGQENDASKSTKSPLTFLSAFANRTTSSLHSLRPCIGRMKKGRITGLFLFSRRGAYSSSSCNWNLLAICCCTFGGTAA